MKCLEIKIVLSPTSAMPMSKVYICILSALMSKTLMQLIEKLAAYSIFIFFIAAGSQMSILTYLSIFAVVAVLLIIICVTGKVFYRNHKR